MNSLIIKQPYIDLILEGKKTWEIRGSKTKIRGRIGLIQSGSGLILGEVDLIDCIGPLTYEEYDKNRDKHQSNSKELYYKKTYAWVLKNPTRYKEPKPYKHPMGAVIWVKGKK